LIVRKLKAHQQFEAGLAHRVADCRLSHRIDRGICVPGLRPRGSHAVTRSINIPALDGLNLDDLIRDNIFSNNQVNVQRVGSAGAF